MVALRGQSTIDRASAERDQHLAVLAELAQHVNILGIAHAAFDQTYVAGTTMLDVGQRRTCLLYTSRCV